MPEPPIDTDLIDEAVLALMFLTLHKDGTHDPLWRAWKTFDWDAMDRLHAKGFIADPVGKARSVMLTEEGVCRCEAAYYRLFTQREAEAAEGA